MTKAFVFAFLFLAGNNVVRTEHFIVDADSTSLAREVGEEAERLFEEIVDKWAGGKIEHYTFPCLIVVDEIDDCMKPWAYTYSFGGDVRGISIRASHQEIMDNSLPHEITHFVVITHYEGKLPLWADEGIAMSSERDCPARLGGKCGQSSLFQLFTTDIYPSEWRPFYGQSYSVTNYLVQEYGVDKFIKFSRQGNSIGWDTCSRLHFEVSVGILQKNWRKYHAKNPGGGKDAPQSTSRDEGVLLRGHRPVPGRGRRLAESHHASAQQ